MSDSETQIPGNRRCTHHHRRWQELPVPQRGGPADQGGGYGCPECHPAEHGFKVPGAGVPVVVGRVASSPQHADWPNHWHDPNKELPESRQPVVVEWTVGVRDIACWVAGSGWLRLFWTKGQNTWKFSARWPIQWRVEGVPARLPVPPDFLGAEMLKEAWLDTVLGVPGTLDYQTVGPQRTRKKPARPRRPKLVPDRLQVWWDPKTDCMAADLSPRQHDATLDWILGVLGQGGIAAELERRGLDIKTLRFQVDRKPAKPKPPKA